MPESLTTLQRPEREAVRLAALAQLEQVQSGLICDPAARVYQIMLAFDHAAEPVFSAGDMQAAQERAEEAEQDAAAAAMRVHRALDAAHVPDPPTDEDEDGDPIGSTPEARVALLVEQRDQARADLVDARRRRGDAMDALEALPEGAREWTVGYDAGRAQERKESGAREVELAEALQAMVDAVEVEAAAIESEGSKYGLTEEMERAQDLAAQLLAGSSRSHEVVPLGTQEAARDLVVALNGYFGEFGKVPGTEAEAMDSARKRVAALVEGVERTPTPVLVWALSEEMISAALSAAESYRTECDSKRRAASLESCGHTGAHIPRFAPLPSVEMARALTAALELQAGERTHTLVPNEDRRATASILRQGASFGQRALSPAQVEAMCAEADRLDPRPEGPWRP